MDMSFLAAHARFQDLRFQLPDRPLVRVRFKKSYSLKSVQRETRNMIDI